jgi:hypothetical protein
MAHDELVKRTFSDAAKAWRELAAAYSNLKRQPSPVDTAVIRPKS